MVRNAEGKSVVDVARLMNKMNATNSSIATTSSNGVTIGGILFTVLMAAGLDPMTESAASEATIRYMMFCVDVSYSYVLLFLVHCHLSFPQ